MTKLLVSCVDEDEALEAYLGGADIIDVKNPVEGSFGANFPWIIAKVRRILPDEVIVSATLGDVPNLPGTVSLAALGAAVSGANIVKVGLFGVKTFEEAVYLMKKVREAVNSLDSHVLVVAGGYGDAFRKGAFNPRLVPKVAYLSDADVAMVDTLIKDGRKLFDFLSQNELKKFVSECRDYGVLAAVAGSLKKEDIKKCISLEFDVIGFRGAACEGGDRLNGKISRYKVKELLDEVKKYLYLRKKIRGMGGLRSELSLRRGVVRPRSPR